MKTKDRLEQLRKQFERLSKDSLSAAGTANASVYSGIQKFADKELKALHDYYDDALAALRSQKKSGSGLKTVVETQFDLLQKTITRLIDHGRESLEQAMSAAKREASKTGATLKSTVPPRKSKSSAPKKAKSTVPPKKAASTVSPKPAKSTVPPKKTSSAAPKKVKSTVPPKKAASTVPPKKAATTVPPKKAASTVRPRKKKAAASAPVVTEAPPSASETPSGDS